MFLEISTFVFHEVDGLKGMVYEPPTLEVLWFNIGVFLVNETHNGNFNNRENLKRIIDL